MAISIETDLEFIIMQSIDSETKQISIWMKIFLKKMKWFCNAQYPMRIWFKWLSIMLRLTNAYGISAKCVRDSGVIYQSVKLNAIIWKYRNV